SLDVGIRSSAKAIHVQLDLPTRYHVGVEYLRDAQIDGAEREQRDRCVAVYRNRSLELQIRARALNGGFLQCQHTSAVIRLNGLLSAKLDFVFVRYRKRRDCQVRVKPRLVFQWTADSRVNLRRAR